MCICIFAIDQTHFSYLYQVPPPFYLNFIKNVGLSFSFYSFIIFIFLTAMIQEPPPLPLSSYAHLKSAVSRLLEEQRLAQNHVLSPEYSYRMVDPANQEQEKPKRRPVKAACKYCNESKIKCDINVPPSEPCPRANKTCKCEYHNKAAPSPPAGNNSSANNRFPSNETIPSTDVFRKSGLLPSGHYAGETSFCGSLRLAEQSQAIMIENSFPAFPGAAPTEPVVSIENKRYLIDVYYNHLNPYYPSLNKQDLLNEFEALNNGRDTYLSPLFFCALFARAAALAESTLETDYEELSRKYLDHADYLVNFYRDKPRCSTVLALVMMTNHLEQEKNSKNLTKAWLWAGDAFRMALDLGIHRSSTSEGATSLGQLCIRTFWLAYITDCTISITYGRPTSIEEKVL
jgi:hypothetical protein